MTLITIHTTKNMKHTKDSHMASDLCAHPLVDRSA